MQARWFVLAIFTGLLVPLQAAMNAKMRAFVVNPIYSALVNFIVGLAVGLVIMVGMIGAGHPGQWRDSLAAPWWAWCGGVIGMLFVTTTVLCLPKIGSSNAIACLVAGQLIGSLVADHFGWLGLAARAITPLRVVGALMMLTGVWLMKAEG